MKAVPDTALFVACLLIALILRLAVILREPDQLSVDRDAYLGIAKSIVEGRGYSSPNSSVPTAYRPPLYPLTLAAGFRLVPNLPVVAEINLIAGLASVWLTISLGRHLLLGRLRYAAGLLVAIDPLLLQYSTQPMTESLCTFLTALWLWSVIAGWPSRFVKSLGGDDQFVHGILVGITFGVLVLCRPTFWPMAALFAVWWLARRGKTQTSNSVRDIKGWIGVGVGSAIGTILTVSPWLVRNWLVFGVPILTTTHGGYTLLLGNNSVFSQDVVQQPWGTVWSEESLRRWEADRKFLLAQAIGPAVTEIEEDDWNSLQARSYMMTHPGSTFAAAIHRIRSLWNTTPQGEAAGGVNSIVLTAVGWYYTMILTAGFLGMLRVLWLKNRVGWLPLFVLIFSTQAVHLFYWTNTRMRAPLTPAITLFAVALIAKRRDDAECTQVKCE